MHSMLQKNYEFIGDRLNLGSFFLQQGHSSFLTPQALKHPSWNICPQGVLYNFSG